SGISVTIVLCAGRMADRRTVLPNASVDALSIGISSSTNCDPPSSDAEAKRTIFIRVLRIARNWALVYLSGLRQEPRTRRFGGRAAGGSHRSALRLIPHSAVIPPSTNSRAPVT